MIHFIITIYYYYSSITIAIVLYYLYYQYYSSYCQDYSYEEPIEACIGAVVCSGRSAASSVDLAQDGVWVLRGLRFKNLWV